jgi:tetratricopeptide (TPR) repeat protein
MKRAWLVAALLLPASVACNAPDGSLERYRLEQALWRAQFFERRINISFMRASSSDTENAIAAFHRILDDNPLDRPGAAQWDPAVVHDIHEIEIVSRIALANLYYLSERYADAGSFYRETLEAGELSLDRSLEARLGVARSLYLAGETSAVMEQCAEIFRELSDDPAFWSGERDVDPVFLNVPASLVRMYHEVGDSARANEFATRATDFYERVVAQRPETGVAWQSRLGLLQIALVRREWNVAIERLDGLRQSSSVTAEDHAGLDLLSAEIAAFALRNTADAERQFEAITQPSIRPNRLWWFALVSRSAW